jgi:large subunit ribosomal protein L29
MKASDLREKSVEDLRELQESLAHDTFQNRLKNFTNRLDDTSQIRKTKRDLARVITLLRERGAGPASAAKASPSAEAKASPSVDAKAAKAVEAKASKSVEAKASKSVEAKASKAVDAKASPSVDAKASPTVDAKASPPDVVAVPAPPADEAPKKKKTAKKSEAKQS